MSPRSAWFLAAVALCGLLMVPPSVQAAVSCPARGAGTTDLRGLVGSAQPVILVHGWTGGPLQDTRSKLEQLDSASTRQYFLFDYKRYNTVWTDDAGIAACLAEYIHEVSEAHREGGGNGRVFLVAHSMGGLAIRFALDQRYGGIAGLADSVGGVTTLNTPHTGSMWGRTWVAQLLSQKSDILQGGVSPTISTSLPAIESRAWVCLQGGPEATWDGCAEPPPLPSTVPLEQVVGQVSVRRTLFGFEAYTMDLGGDGIVPMESQWGGGTSFRSVACAVDAGDLIGINPLRPAILMMADSTTLNIFSGAQAANSAAPLLALEPILAGLLRAGCSHLGITTDDEALRRVDEALAEQATHGGLQSVGPLRAGAPVPASCGNPAAIAKQGTTDFGRRGGGWLSLKADEYTLPPVFGDLTGDGLSDAAVVYGCTAGGVTWPEWLLVYSAGTELVGAYYMGDLPTTQEHADFTSLRLSDDGLAVTWASYSGAGFNVRHFQGMLTMSSGELQLTNVSPQAPDLEVGPGFVGQLRVGASADDLVGKGLVERVDDICDVRWETTLMPEVVFTDFREGSPDDLDVAGVRMFEENFDTVVSTAEGAELGQWAVTLKEIYGDRLEYGHFVGEGEYDAYVLFGEHGALMFALSPDEEYGSQNYRTVEGMYAVRGTSMTDLRHAVGGC